MALNIDTIRSLDASKTYYLANSTGEIKEAGAWQKFKCYFGIGDARQKVQKLIDQVKVALLAASHESDNAALAADIKSYDDDRHIDDSASGRALADIANRFATVNADKIASTEAGGIAAKRIHAAVKDSIRSCLRREDWPEDAERYLERAAKPLVDHPPMKDAGGGRRVLDADAFEKQLADILDGASNDLVHVATSARLGMPHFDKAYLDHVFATFYDENGVRNGKTEADLRPAIDVRLEAARARAGRCPVTGDKEIFGARMREAVEACGNDTDLLYTVIRFMDRILVNDGGQIRSRAAVLQKIEDYKENYKALREATKGSPAAYLVGCDALSELNGRPLPRGSVAAVARAARSIELSAIAELGPSSSALDIHKAVLELHFAILRILHDTELSNHAEGDDILQARTLLAAFLLERFGPETMRNIEAALETPNAALVQDVYYKLHANQIDIPDDIPDGVSSAMSVQAGDMSTFVNLFKAAVDLRLGLPNRPIDPRKAVNMPYHGIGIANMIVDILREVEADAKSERENYLATRAVKGEGPAAGRVRQMISALLEEYPFRVADTMKERYTDNVKPLLSLAALTDAKKVAKGELKDTGFAQAIADGTLEVELEGGGKLSSDPDEALDQLARQIADREDATFATLDPTARRKVALIAGLLGDKAKKAISDGVGIALDPEGGRSVLAISGGGEKRRVKLDCKGGNHIVMQIQTERTGATLRTGAESYRLGPGSAVRIGYQFVIAQRGMMRFERDVDLDAFDGTEAEEIASAPGNVPGRVNSVREALGENLVLGSGFNPASVDFVLN